MLMQNYRSAAFWQSIRDNPAYLPLIDEIRAIYDASAQPELPSLTFSKRLLFTTAEEAEVAVNEPESEGRMETIYKIDIAADPAAGEITTKIDIKA